MKTILELSEALGLAVEGDPHISVTRVTSLAAAAPDHLSFVIEEKYAKDALQSKARALIAANGISLPGKTILRARNPMLSVVEAIQLLEPAREPRPGVDPTATIGADCEIAESAEIRASAVLGARVRIGEHTVIGSNVTLEDDVRIGGHSAIHPGVTIHPRSQIGNRVIIHAGSVIGSRGYGYVQDKGRHWAIPHSGNVIIEDDVEIGANNTIDRAVFESTIIGKGTKIDNLVHIAHNVEVGEHSLILGQVGVAGSTKLGSYFVISGQSGVADHLTVSPHVTVGPKSLLTRPGRSEEIYYGYPARPAKQWRRSIAILNQLSRLSLGVARKFSPPKSRVDEDDG
ncbi:MAG: UDP-3-O-(3-hydroxymyristoyl)glucosamine N-acyltransferase [bacterium]